MVLTILHRDSKEPVDLRIKRDAIPLISVKSRELEPGYYWVRLTRFSERTTQELLDALSDAKRKGPHQRASSSTCATTPAGCWIRPSASPTRS